MALAHEPSSIPAHLLGLLLGASQAFGGRDGARHAALGNKGLDARPSTQTIGLVRIPIPWYAPRFVVRSRFRGAVPEYEAMGALDEKYYVLTDDGRFGGFYVWRSRGDAERYYSEAWRRGVRERRGADPEVTLLDVATLLEGNTRIEGDLVGERSIGYPAYATLTLWRAPHTETPRLTAMLTRPSFTPPGLVRAFVVSTPNAIGLVAVWATRSFAESGRAHEALRALGEPASARIFEVPVLTCAGLRARP